MGTRAEHKCVSTMLLAVACHCLRVTAFVKGPFIPQKIMAHRLRNTEVESRRLTSEQMAVMQMQPQRKTYQWCSCFFCLFVFCFGGGGHPHSSPKLLLNSLVDLGGLGWDHLFDALSGVDKYLIMSQS